jgi:hypothetical protein
LFSATIPVALVVGTVWDLEMATPVWGTCSCSRFRSSCSRLRVARDRRRVVPSTTVFAIQPRLLYVDVAFLMALSPYVLLNA